MRKDKIITEYSVDDLENEISRFLSSPYISVIDIKILNSARTAHIIYEEVEHVKLNGILWSVSNFEKEKLLNGESCHVFCDLYGFHYDFSHLCEMDINVRDRLPSFEEFKSLFNLPHAWDKSLKGMWFAEKYSDLSTSKSIFIPAFGYRRRETFFLNGTFVDKFAHGVNTACCYHIRSNKENEFFACYFDKDKIELLNNTEQEKFDLNKGLSYMFCCPVRLVRDL